MKKILFIDRDGTMISEPPVDYQVDRYEKLKLEPLIIPSLLKLKSAGYEFVMVSNQDGLGGESFPTETFTGPHELMMQIFESQGIRFNEVLICPHFDHDSCDCRKPKVGLVLKYLQSTHWDRAKSYVIGDRATDLELAKNMGIEGIQYHRESLNWAAIATQILDKPRVADITRKTHETEIHLNLNLDEMGNSHIETGIHFFDHMLDQIATHGGFKLKIKAKGDIHVDDHHMIEDVGIVLGEAIRTALGDKRGIARFGFVLPMDECLASCSLDLSGRPHLQFSATFSQNKVGDMSTEMVSHFFKSLSYSLAASIHLEAKGENDHHKVESLFKVFGRTLRQAIRIESQMLPSSKGVL